MFASWRKPAANAEVQLRRSRKSTYTEPLRDSSKQYSEQELAALKEYIGEFYRTIYKRREECNKICLQYPKTVGYFYGTLVPRTVTLEDFWQRYFYRCSVDRVIAEWDQQAVDKKNQIQQSMQSAQSMWSNAIGTVTGEAGSPEAEVEARRSRKTTYTEPLRDPSKTYSAFELADMKQYISDFYTTIYKRENECHEIAKKHPKTVGHFYNTLVPRTVTFEDFWQRYFFRCDVERVTREWEQRAEDKKNADVEKKQQMDDRIQKSMQNAQNLLSSALGSNKEEESTLESSAKAEVILRRSRKETYTQPLRDKTKIYTEQELADLKQYRYEFYNTIYKRKEECEEICRQYPKTVGQFHDILIPRTVTFEDFWQRYFYRCDVDRLVKEMKQEAIKEKELEEAEAEMERDAIDDMLDPFSSESFMKNREAALDVLKTEMGVSTNDDELVSKESASVTPPAKSSPPPKAKISPQSASNPPSPPRHTWAASLVDEYAESGVETVVSPEKEVEMIDETDEKSTSSSEVAFTEDTPMQENPPLFKSTNTVDGDGEAMETSGNDAFVKASTMLDDSWAEALSGSTGKESASKDTITDAKSKASSAAPLRVKPSSVQPPKSVAKSEDPAPTPKRAKVQPTDVGQGKKKEVPDETMKSLFGFGGTEVAAAVSSPVVTGETNEKKVAENAKVTEVAQPAAPTPKRAKVQPTDVGQGKEKEAPDETMKPLFGFNDTEVAATVFSPAVTGETNEEKVVENAKVTEVAPQPGRDSPMQLIEEPQHAKTTATTDRANDTKVVKSNSIEISGKNTEKAGRADPITSSGLARESVHAADQTLLAADSGVTEDGAHVTQTLPVEGIAGKPTSGQDRASTSTVPAIQTPGEANLVVTPLAKTVAQHTKLSEGEVKQSEKGGTAQKAKDRELVQEKAQTPQLLRGWGNETPKPKAVAQQIKPSEREIKQPEKGEIVQKAKGVVVQEKAPLLLRGWGNEPSKASAEVETAGKKQASSTPLRDPKTSEAKKAAHMNAKVPGAEDVAAQKVQQKPPVAPSESVTTKLPTKSLSVVTPLKASSGSAKEKHSNVALESPHVEATEKPKQAETASSPVIARKEVKNVREVASAKSASHPWRKNETGAKGVRSNPFSRWRGEAKEPKLKEKSTTTVVQQPSNLTMPLGGEKPKSDTKKLAAVEKDRSQQPSTKATPVEEVRPESRTLEKLAPQPPVDVPVSKDSTSTSPTKSELPASDQPVSYVKPVTSGSSIGSSIDKKAHRVTFSDDASKTPSDLQVKSHTKSSVLSLNLIIIICVGLLALGVGAVILLYQDFLCAPAAMGEITTPYSEAPFWAPPEWKPTAFNLVCGTKRRRTRLYWSEQKGDVRELRIEDEHSELLLKLEKLQSARIEAARIVATNKKDAVQMVEAPWLVTDRNTS